MLSSVPLMNSLRRHKVYVQLCVVALSQSHYCHENATIVTYLLNLLTYLLYGAESFLRS